MKLDKGESLQVIKACNCNHTPFRIFDTKLEAIDFLGKDIYRKYSIRSYMKRQVGMLFPYLSQIDAQKAMQFIRRSQEGYTWIIGKAISFKRNTHAGRAILKSRRSIILEYMQGAGVKVRDLDTAVPGYIQTKDVEGHHTVESKKARPLIIDLEKIYDFYKDADETPIVEWTMHTHRVGVKEQFHLLWEVQI